MRFKFEYGSFFEDSESRELDELSCRVPNNVISPFLDFFRATNVAYYKKEFDVKPFIDYHIITISSIFTTVQDES